MVTDFTTIMNSLRQSTVEMNLIWSTGFSIASAHLLIYLSSSSFHSTPCSQHTASMANSNNAALHAEPVSSPSTLTQLDRPKPDTKTGSRSSPLSPSCHPVQTDKGTRGCEYKSITVSLWSTEDINHQPGWRFCGSGKELRRGRLL